jgi:hypothetical protein
VTTAWSETTPGPRWGQLTYASFDRNDGTGGGWQIKDVTGGLDQDEQELLRGRVQTQMDPGVEVPRFPTPAELEELPRRLVYAPAEGTETALWHHVPAGHDASGRPGNVFAHVVLDRNPNAADEGRPIERWRSADWLTPFGPDSVLAATLTDAEPPAPGPLNRDTIGSWLFAPRQWRMQTLAVLLDAVRSAFRGGPLVVVGVEDTDEAACWIAAVSFAMSAGTSRRFFFSTLERPVTLAEAQKRGLHLVGVPLSDLPDLTRREGIVVVDPSGPINLGDLDGEPHRTVRGDAIDVGEWSVLIQELFIDPCAFNRTVSEFDRLAGAIGDSGVDPVWPAAMLVSQHPDAESRREAARVLAECAPPQLRSVPELYAAAIRALRSETETRPDRAWDQVVKLGAQLEKNPATTGGEVAVAVYVELALADEPWLAGQGPAKVPSTHYYSPVPEPELVRLARLMSPEISPFTEELPPDVMLAEVRAGLHFVELALRLGLAHDPDVGNRLYRVCQQSILPTLLHPTLGPALVDSVDRTVCVETKHWLWTQLMAVGLTGMPGQRIAPVVLETLGPTESDPDPLGATWAWLSGHPEPQTAEISPLVGELAWHRLLRGDRGVDGRFFAVWESLSAHARDNVPAILSAAVPLLIPPLPLDRLLQLQLRWQRAVPSEWFLGALLQAPLVDAEAGFLAEQLITEGAESPMMTTVLAARGGLAGPEWLAADNPVIAPAGLELVLEKFAEGITLARGQGAVIDPELLRRINALVVLSLLAVRARIGAVADPRALERAAGRVQAQLTSLGAARAAFSPEEAKAVAVWCDEANVSSRALTELFLLADPRSMLRAPRDGIAAWIHAVDIGQVDSASLPAFVLTERLCRNAASRDQTHDEALMALRSTPGSSDEKAVRQTEKFLAAWLRQAQQGRVRR